MFISLQIETENKTSCSIVNKKNQNFDSKSECVHLTRIAGKCTQPCGVSRRNRVSERIR